jgi:hypothetical protein
LAVGWGAFSASRRPARRTSTPSVARRGLSAAAWPRRGSPGPVGARRCYLCAVAGAVGRQGAISSVPARVGAGEGVTVVLAAVVHNKICPFQGRPRTFGPLFTAQRNTYTPRAATHARGTILYSPSIACASAVVIPAFGTVSARRGRASGSAAQKLRCRRAVPVRPCGCGLSAWRPPTRPPPT